MLNKLIKKISSKLLISYEQWLEQLPEFRDKKEECKECNGNGSEECYACGHEEECNYCNGIGSFDLSYDEYKCQREKDIKNITNYLISNATKINKYLQIFIVNQQKKEKYI